MSGATALKKLLGSEYCNDARQMLDASSQHGVGPGRHGAAPGCPAAAAAACAGRATGPGRRWGTTTAPPSCSCRGAPTRPRCRPPGAHETVLSTHKVHPAGYTACINPLQAGIARLLSWRSSLSHSSSAQQGGQATWTTCCTPSIMVLQNCTLLCPPLHAAVQLQWHHGCTQCSNISPP